MEDYTLHSLLDTYGLGKSYSASRNCDDAPVILLTFKEAEVDIAKIKEQLEVLQKLSLEVFVKYLNIFVDDEGGECVFVIDACNGLPLSCIIEKCKAERSYFPEMTIVNILLSVTKHLESLFAITKVHNGYFLDHLDPSRIFYDQETGIVRLDVVHYHTQGDAMSHYRYQSPEDIDKQQLTDKSDTWVLGCLAYELAGLRPPFEAPSKVAFQLKVKDGRYASLPTVYSESFKKVVKAMLTQDLVLRPNFEQLKEMLLACAESLTPKGSPYSSSTRLSAFARSASPVTSPEYFLALSSSGSEMKGLETYGHSDKGGEDKEAIFRRWELQLEAQEIEITRREKSLVYLKEELDKSRSHEHTASSLSVLQLRVSELEGEILALTKEASSCHNSPKASFSSGTNTPKASFDGSQNASDKPFSNLISSRKNSSTSCLQSTVNLAPDVKAKAEKRAEMANQIAAEIANFLISEGYVQVDDEDGIDLAVKKAVHKVTSLIVTEKDIVKKEQDLFKSVMFILAALAFSFLIIMYF